MKRLIALVLSCTMLMTSVHLEVFAAEFRETEPVSTAGGTYETAGISVDFQLMEETTAPEETVETIAVTEATLPQTEPAEETLPAETTEEETVEPTVSEAPPADTTLQSGDFYYTVLTEGTCAITAYVGSATEVVVPETLEGLTVTAIADNGLAGCDKVTSISLPETVTTLGANSFGTCFSLASINLPEGITEIPASAFDRCGSLTSIELPSTVTSIGDYAFYECKALVSVNIPAGVTAIGKEAFYDCRSLTGIVLPEGLTSIGSRAFYQNWAMTSLTLPGTVTEMGAGTFANCYYTAELILSEGITGLGEGAFSEWNAVTQVTIPASVTTIPAKLFYGCDSLQTASLPDTVTSIGTLAFCQCSVLSGITLPAALTALGEQAFNSCRALTSVVIPGGLAEIPKYAFSSCSALASVTLSEGLTAIGDYAFNECPVTAIEFPDSLQTLGEYAFMSTNLTEVSIPEGVTALPQGVFNNCGKLTQVKLPETLTSVGDKAFGGCSALEAIDLPEGLETLDHYAFNNCSTLKSITIPGGVKTIGTEAFRGCSALETVVLQEGLETIGSSAFSSCKSLKEMVLPESVTTLGQGVFLNCTALTSTNLPQTMTSIPYCLFDSCESLTAVEIPAGVTAIEERAFSGCESLTELELPAGVTSIGHNAFSNCAVTELNLPEGLISIGRNAFSSSGLTSITVPESVAHIGTSAFCYCSSLKETKLPNSITSMDTYMFEGCTALETVELPENLQEISGFRGCTSLKSIDLPDTLTTINDEAFSGCSSLKEIVAPDSVTVIRDRAFSGCTGLLAVQLPDTLGDIRGSVFAGCSSLERFVMPNAMTVVPYNMFQNCTNLQEVLLPAGLTTIHSFAFGGCKNLTELSLPTSLQTIEFGAFYDCGDLGKLHIPSSVTSIGNDAFAYTDVVIYCDLQSEAAIYAIDHRLPMVEQNDTSNDANTHLDMGSSYFKTNIDGISATGNLSFVVQYAFKPTVSVSDMEIEIHIPESMQLEANTLTLDGKTVLDGTEYTMDYNNGILKLPLTNTSGAIRFQLKPVSYETIAMYALMYFNDGSGTVREVVGAVYEDVPVLSVSAVSRTAAKEVMVRGVTIPGNTVTVYVNNVQRATATANKIGDYSVTVDIGDVKSGSSCRITAETVMNGKTSAASSSVYYDASAPQLLDFTVSHMGRTLSLADTQILSPVMSMSPGYEFTFTAKFDNNENIKRVFFVSDRNGDRKYLEANWNAATGEYVATGRFDENNPSYVPGELSVKYVEYEEPVNFAKTQIDDLEAAREQLPDNWKNAAVTINENANGKLDATLAMKGASGNDLEFRVVSEEMAIPEGVTAQNAESQGYMRVTDNYGYVLYIRGIDTANEFGVDYLDFNRGVWAKNYICDAWSSGNTAPYANGRGGCDITPRSLLNDTLETYGDLAEGMENSSDLLSDVNNSDMSESEKTNARAAIGMGVYWKFGAAALALAGIAICIPLLAMGSPFLAGAAALGAGGSAILGVIGELVDRNEERIRDKARSKTAGHKKGNLDPRWIIDPSGYLYDIETEERIVGATVTACWIPYDEENESFWEEKPADTEYGEVWSSLEYSQLNPLLTNYEGRYAWDVPEGWWRVKAEHPDYETAWSDWVPVPPIQTEVNIAMKAKPDPDRGDYDGDGEITTEDAVYLVWHTLFEDIYPVQRRDDLNGDGTLDTLDAAYLLWHLLFPTEYPL